MNPNVRQQFAQLIGKEITDEVAQRGGRQTFLQNIHRIGYASGMGVL